MAGHSQFKNIMYRKGAQDAKRAKIFTKIIRELTVAAKAGPDIHTNSRLRAAVAAAREANMPKDNVDRAIKRALGNDGDIDYQSIRYEGYGPHNIALIVETLTDNRNRTASEVRATFNKYGGHLGELGSVSFLFDHLGFVQYPLSIASPDEMFDAALEGGAEIVESTNHDHELYTSVEHFSLLRDNMSAKYGDPIQAKLVWKPKSLIALTHETAPSFFKFLDILEDNDDVQSIWGNYDVTDEILESVHS